MFQRSFSDQPVPLLTSERSIVQDVCNLRRGVNKFNLDHWVKVGPVKQPFEHNAVSAGNMSHGRAPAFHDHLDHRTVVFEIKQTCLLAVRLEEQNQFPLSFALPTFVTSSVRSDLARDFSLLECHATGLSVLESATHQCTNSHKLSARLPSTLRPTSDEISSASVVLCETAVCFLQDQKIGTSVRLPKTHNVPPDLDVEFAQVSCEVTILK